MDPSYKKIIKELIDKQNQFGVKWKITSTRHIGKWHLKKRQRRKELSDEWNLKDYNTCILNIMNDVDNDIHLYYLSTFKQKYFCFDDGHWIVIIGKDGVMETCMKGNPENYFSSNPGYTYLGKVKDVL